MDAPVVPWSDVLFWGALLMATLSIAAVLRDVHVKKSVDALSMTLRVAIFVGSVLLAVTSKLNAKQSAAHDADLEDQLQRMSSSIGTVQTGGTPRGLTPAQVDALAAALRGAPRGTAVDVERCISDASAVLLQDDFGKAVTSAALPLTGGSTTVCVPGDAVFYLPGDETTASLFRRALADAGIPVGVQLPPVGMNPMPVAGRVVLYTGLKDAQNP